MNVPRGLKTKALRKKLIDEIPNAMLRSMLEGECLDVRKIGRPLRGTPGDFILGGFLEGIDYADVDNGEWIWSIGRNKKTGQIRASTSGRYYEHPDYECLWVR
ncbi:MAG: hypothetical protein QOJ64_2348 [Acidobacteriota bacterium]|jgi:hypothetical protein|nr:hypothetical protein [Acidobacteriota bacterium]